MELNQNNTNNSRLKKKKVRSSITTTSTSTCLLSVYEILTRLPVKSLFRFKTVSKEWSSFIEKDQNFIDLHILTHSKTHHSCRIFIVVRVPLTEKEFCITADLFSQEDNVPMKAVVDSVREVDSTYYYMITKPVNGLFCSIDQSQLEQAIRICNISTRHVSKSFRSTLSEEPEYDQYGNWVNPLEYMSESFYYGFGFDPATNEHKLVCVRCVDPDDYGGRSFICEVLTLARQGSINSWRMINDVPPDEITDESVYVNGAIYWNTDGLQLGRWNHQMNTDESSPIYIVAFDVGKEKFRTIIIPDLLLEEATYHFGRDLGYNGYVRLLEVSGRLAMLIRVNHSVFNMYIYEDNDDYKKEEEVDINKASTSTSFSSKNDERWIEAKSITLPLSLEENYVEFHTFVGSDDKIIVTFNEKGEWCKKVGKKKCSSFYCFNWKKDSWTEFEVSGIPSRVPHICFNSSFITFTESLLPVNNQAALSSNIVVAEDQLHSIF